MKRYTVKNKNIDALSRIRWWIPFWKKYIKLYREDPVNIYLPIWKFWSVLSWTKILNTEFEYDNISEANALENWFVSREQIDEQQYIMNEIKNNSLRTWLIEMKTWRWKWNLILKIIEHFQEPTLIAVHSIQTLEELAEKFKKFTNYSFEKKWDCLLWVYYWKHKNEKQITITTHNSLRDNADMFKWKYWILIYDEADYNLSSDMITVMTMIDVDWIFWLTWTPNRQELDTDDLTLLYWDIIKYKWQKNNWYNIIPNIVRIKYITENFFSWNHWSELIQQMIEDKSRFNSQIEFIMSMKNEFNFWCVLVERVEEAKKYYEELSPHIKTILSTWNEEIWTIEDLKESWKWLLIGTAEKIWRWVDIPMIDSIFLFFPCKFRSTVVQACGRALRTYWDKSSATIYDRSDYPILSKQSSERMNAYKLEYWDKINIKEIKIIKEK